MQEISVPSTGAGRVDPQAALVARGLDGPRVISGVAVSTVAPRRGRAVEVLE